MKSIHTDKKLVIAGGSSDADAFANELKELAKGDDRIIFTGFVQGQLLDELYSNAATKKSNELMAHAYSKLYNIPSTGLRFFTVYGPAGRPDMAYFGFTNKRVKGETIKIFNYGKTPFIVINADDYYGKESIMCSPFEDGIVNGTGFYRLNIRFFSRSCSRYLK